ncbi:Yqey-like protein-domain-containing protein [Nemania sp. FL0916]|nr:Yqey-like protein-domain-containing protein [Nemania sp. FL0916]
MSLRPSSSSSSSLQMALGQLRPRASPSSRAPSTLFPAFAFVTRSYSSSSSDLPPSPPLLQKIKADLKTAMRAKDAARLSVLRAVIASTTNASKTSSPITTDAALVALLRKQARGCAEARDEAAAAKRDDLVAKEAAQIAVLDEYMAASGVEELSGSKLEDIVRDAVTGLGADPKMGDAMKTLLAPGGPLDGKNVEKTELARVVKEIMSL